MHCIVIGAVYLGISCKLVTSPCANHLNFDQLVSQTAGFRAFSTWALCALEPCALNPAETSCSAQCGQARQHNAGFHTCTHLHTQTLIIITLMYYPLK